MEDSSAVCDKHPEDAQVPFSFVVAADPQIGCDTIETVGRLESDLLVAAVDKINQLKPVCVFMLGDMTDVPGEGGQLAESDRQYAEFKRIIAGLDDNMPIRYVPGNHDVGDVPTPDSLDRYRGRFGRDRYSFVLRNCLCVVLNSPVMHRPDHCADEDAEQLRWLQETLRQAWGAAYAHVLVFMHHSIYLESRDDEEGYFVLPRRRRIELLELFAECGVRAVFSGHRHQDVVLTDGRIELITTSAIGLPLGTTLPGCRLVTVHADRIEHEYHSCID